MRIAASGALLLIACGGAPGAPPSAAAASTASPSAASATSAPSSTAPSSPASPSSPSGIGATAPKKGTSMRALAVMKMEGDLSTDALAAAIDARGAALAACVADVRRTDRVVGSLNLQVTVAGPDVATLDLQSPVNEVAKKCVLGALMGLRVSPGTGRAMVLLSIEE